MFPYAKALADIAAEFPGSVMTALEVTNKNEEGVDLTETGTLPGSVDGEGKLRINLDQVPLQQAGMTVEISSVELEIVKPGAVVTSGQVAVSMQTGVMEFHASRVGASVEVNYKGKGTPLMAYIVGKLQKEIVAVQTQSAALKAITDALGTMATQDSDDVSITSGVIGGDTDINTSGSVTAGELASLGGVTSEGSARIVHTNPSGVAGYESYAVGSQSTVNMRRVNGSLETPEALDDGDIAGRVQLIGYDGTSYGSGARIEGIATEDWNSSARGMKMEFSGCDNGSSSPETKFETSVNGMAAKSAMKILNTMAASSAENGEIFFDSSNSNKLSVKDTGGTVYELAVV